MVSQDFYNHFNIGHQFPKGGLKMDEFGRNRETLEHSQIFILVLTVSKKYVYHPVFGKQGSLIPKSAPKESKRDQKSFCFSPDQKTCSQKKILKCRTFIHGSPRRSLGRPCIPRDHQQLVNSCSAASGAQALVKIGGYSSYSSGRGPVAL